jgi:hypothetical protein
VRQGDICAPRVFPIWNLNEYEVSHNPAGVPTRSTVHVIEQGKPFPVVVCAHDCDIENPRSRRGILVAPLLPPPVEGDELDGLVASRNIGADETWEWINLFPVHLPDGEGGHDWRVVDFSAIIAVGSAKKAVAALRASKEHELNEETRERFRLKLAAFVGRGG